jgi:predicted alpha/beta superfamily hydrolase
VIPHDRQPPDAATTAPGEIHPQPYPLLPTSTVAGTLKLLPQVYSPQLDLRRDLLVYLPPDYALSARRYPVIYMHDGQNLFDQATSFAGEWHVDETLEALAPQGTAAIVVGIPNGGEARIDEYSPYPERRVGRGGRGRNYLDFLADSVKPLVDGLFRTLPEPQHTVIAGSSMGGLISLYGFFAFPHAFGFAGVMSPALWFGRGQIMKYVAKQPPILGRIYLDMGTAEGAEPVKMEAWRRSLLARSTTLDGELYAMLVAKGYRPGRDIRYVVDEGAPHNEAAWAARLPAAMRFLLAER